MRSMFPLGLVAGWGRLVTAFVTAVALLWAGTLLRGPAGLWAGPIAAALACALMLVTWRRAALLTLMAAMLSRRARPSPEGGGLRAVAPAVDHRLRWTTTSAAIRAAGHDLIAVVAVDGPSHIPSVLDHHRVQSAATLPVGVVAEALRQFGVTLSGIDILSVGRRRAAKTHHPYAATYSKIVGDHPAVGRRRTWCVLRMNSLDNVAAVASRDSVAATLATCAQRLAVELTARHCPARVVAGAELADIDTALVAGLGRHTRAHWGGLRHDGGSVTTYWVSPADISTATLDRVWVPDTDCTATAVQLRNGVDIIWVRGEDISYIKVDYRDRAVSPPPTTAGGPTTPPALGASCNGLQRFLRWAMYGLDDRWQTEVTSKHGPPTQGSS